MSCAAGAARLPVTVAILNDFGRCVCGCVFSLCMAGFSVTDVDERVPKPASTQSRSRVSKVCRSSRSDFALKGAEEG